MQNSLLIGVLVVAHVYFLTLGDFEPRPVELEKVSVSAQWVPHFNRTDLVFQKPLVSCHTVANEYTEAVPKSKFCFSGSLNGGGYNMEIVWEKFYNVTVQVEYERKHRKLSALTNDSTCAYGVLEKLKGGAVSYGKELDLLAERKYKAAIIQSAILGFITTIILTYLIVENSDSDFWLKSGGDYGSPVMLLLFMGLLFFPLYMQILNVDEPCMHFIRFPGLVIKLGY